MTTNELNEIRTRAETLHGEGYWTHAGTKTTACADVRRLLRELDALTALCKKVEPWAENAALHGVPAQTSNDIYAACVDMRPIIYR